MGARAIPVARGCGSRTANGLYAECGVGDGGLPVEDFLVDPPHPFVRDELDIVNKATVVEGADGVRHVMMWVGEEHYPHVADFIEEARLYGVSRRLPGDFDMSTLTPGASKMILVHPRAYNAGWLDQALADRCKKLIEGHDARHPLAGTLHETFVDALTPDRVGESRTTTAIHDLRRARAQRTTEQVAASVATPQGLSEDTPIPADGPCLFKCYDLIPAADGVEMISAEMAAELGEQVLYARTIGSTTYTYTPTGESREGLTAGIFGVFPITTFALITREDGTVNERAKAKLATTAWDSYESDQ